MFAVIMAGGSGTRFWPVSRKQRPKQFLNICGKDAMVVETCNRLKPLTSDREIIIVLGREHLKEAETLFIDREIHLIAEPVGRNTAPCIGLGAIYAQYLGCGEPVAFLPADHFIADPSAFLRGLNRACEIAASGALVTLGIIPTRPETGYGYIQRAEAYPDRSKRSAYEVAAFVEKPDLEKARAFISTGDFYWNAGIFVATPETILEEIRQYLPDLHEGLDRLKGNLGTETFETELQEVYKQLESVSFDYGIMEKTKNPVLVVPCDCGWSDVGSWASLYELRKEQYDQNGNLVEGEPLLEGCENLFVASRGGRFVACLGLKNCLVVDTPDALLIGDMGRSQEIRKIVDQLMKDQREDLL